MKNNNTYIIHISLLIISFLASLYLLGFNNLNFLNKNWLYLGDLSGYQIGWEFFRNDTWKFPLGFNPNYGLELANSIVFSDSIPLFAFIFKLFKNFLPENFQYFSLWIVSLASEARAWLSLRACKKSRLSLLELERPK